MLSSVKILQTKVIETKTKKHEKHFRCLELNKLSLITQKLILFHLLANASLTWCPEINKTKLIKINTVYTDIFKNNKKQKYHLNN